jgi:ABC-type transporter Mla subunit MlaD
MEEPNEARVWRVIDAKAGKQEKLAHTMALLADAQLRAQEQIRETAEHLRHADKQLSETVAELRESDRRWRESAAVFDARVDKLVVAIGEMLRRQ